MINFEGKIEGFYTIDDAIKFDYEKCKELQLKHLNKTRTLCGNAKYFVKAEGCKFIDYEGKEHLDMIGAVGVCSVGNNNEFVWNEIKKVFDSKQYMMGTVAFHNVASAFAANMAKLSPGGQLTKMGTSTGGAEAIEGTIKLVKLASRNKKNKEGNRILACEGAFHGKTTGAVSVGGKEKWRMYQHPVMECVDHVPYGDAEALEKVLGTGKYIAFYVEPIQGEGGIIVPPVGYLKKARELCTKYDTIMVVDEIQTGCGRTGKLWCCEHEGIVPDVIAFAKGFSGGLIPFGGYICKEEIYEAAYGSAETAFHHTATYQENGLSAAAGIATLQFLFENNLIEAAGEKGEYFMGELRKIQEKYPTVIKEIRGKGLLIGMEFHKMKPGFEEKYGATYAYIVESALVDKYRIQTVFTINNDAVFRFLPPLTISKEDIDYAVQAFNDCVHEAWKATK